MKEIAQILMLGGRTILAVGLIPYLAGEKLRWFGNLPGDIRVERTGFSFYMPITSMLLISAVLSALVWLVRKMF